MRIPAPRGELSTWLFGLLSGSPQAAGRSGIPAGIPAEVPTVPAGVDPLDDEDLHLALTACYALASYGIDGVDDAWEWHPAVVTFRRRLESRFETALRERLEPDTWPRTPGDVPGWLVALSRRDDGPSLSRFLAREATIEQFREFVIHRSIYTLHEADPHTFAIPRLQGAAKAALVEVQADEYGGGSLPKMHAQLFAETMQGLGLDADHDAYVEVAPGTTLATVNLVWMLGLQRRLRGATAGHLALFELTSAVPNRAYGNGLRRLGFDEDVTRYYDEHVEADSVHDMIAAFDLAGNLATAEPAQIPQIAFGAAALDLVERRFADAVLGAWTQGRSSLLSPATELLAS